MKINNLEIINIYGSDKLIDVVANFLNDGFGEYHPDRSTNYYRKWLSAQTKNCKTLPTTYVGLVNQEVIGAASIVENGMQDYSHKLTPWLNGVYIKPDFRQSGYGRQLCEKVISTLDNKNIKTLYLHTTKVSFYANMGWEVFETTMYKDNLESIMKFSIA